MHLGYSPFGQVYRKVNDKAFWKLNDGVNANKQLNQLMPYQFAGRFTDGMTGYTQMDARWYNPYTSRFVQPDLWNFRNTNLPVAIQREVMRFTGVNNAALLRSPSQQINYGYVGGNPLAWNDWFGLCYPERHGVEPIVVIGGYNGFGETRFTYENRDGSAYEVLNNPNEYDPNQMSKVGLIVGGSVAIAAGSPAVLSVGVGSRVLGALAVSLGLRDVIEGGTGNDPVIQGVSTLTRDVDQAEKIVVAMDLVVLTAELVITPVSAVNNAANYNKLASDLDVVSGSIGTALTASDLINDIEAARDD